MSSKHYDSDLTDGEFAILGPLLPGRKAKGRPRSVALREILDAIFYVLRGGVPWRMLPDGFPCWKTASYYFRRWRLSGLWEAINAALRGGVPWRMLPDGFPCWKTASYYFRRWRLSGLWEAINAALRERVRTTMGRTPQPTASIIDSQSVKTGEMGGPRGYDGGKKANGRKRHLVVDTQGLLLTVKVLPADLHDRPAAELVLAGLRQRFPGVR